MWRSQWTPCGTWVSNVFPQKLSSHILGGTSVASRFRGVIFPAVHPLRDCSKHHLGLLRTRFTGGRWGKVARSELQHRKHGQAGAAGDVAAQGRSYCCPKPLIACTQSGNHALLRGKEWKERGSRHKLEHGKCQLNIRKKITMSLLNVGTHSENLLDLILRDILKEWHHLSTQTGLALSEGLDHRTTTDSLPSYSILGL